MADVSRGPYADDTSRGPEGVTRLAAPHTSHGAGAMPVDVTRYTDIVGWHERVYLTQPKYVRMRYPDDFMIVKEVAKKEDRELFCPVVLWHNLPRLHKHTEARCMVSTYLVYEVDELDSIERLLQALGKMTFPWDCVIYSTYKHRADKPRLRIVVRITRPVTRGEYEVLWSAGLALLRAVGIEPDPLSDVSRMYYLASHPPGVEPFVHHHCLEDDSEPLDVDYILGKEAAAGRHPVDYPPPPKPGEPGFPEPATAAPPPLDPEQLQKALVERLRQTLRERGRDPDSPSDADFSVLDGIEHAGLVDYSLVRPRCAWIRRCEDHPRLSEPEWYAALALWVICIGGWELIHRYSAQDRGGPDGRSRYDYDATIEKAQRAAEFGPPRCERVAALNPEAKAICMACRYRPPEVT